MSADIKQWVQVCERCQIAKDSLPVSHSFMGHLLASRPNEIMAIDFTVLVTEVWCSESHSLRALRVH